MGAQRVGVGLGVGDDAQGDHVDAHLWRQLHRQGAQARLQRALGGQVGHVVREGPRHAGIGETDHRAVAGRQVAGERAHQQQRRDGVHRQRFLQVLAAQGVERRAREGAAGQHQVVEAAGGAHRGGDLLRRVLVAEVAGDGGVDRAGWQRRAQVAEAPGMARGEQHLVAASGQRPRDGHAEASRGPDDEYAARPLQLGRLRRRRRAVGIAHRRLRAACPAAARAPSMVAATARSHESTPFSPPMRPESASSSPAAPRTMVTSRQRAPSSRT